MKLRRGDVVRLRRGSHEYVMKVHKLPKVGGICIVHGDGNVYWTVQLKSIVRVETPKLTEKEWFALRALDLLAVPSRWPIESDPEVRVSVRTLVVLTERGLVRAWKTVDESGPFEWELTAEGKRVAQL